MKNPETQEVLVDVQMEENANDDLLINDSDYTEEMLQVFNEMRKKTYNFPISFLQQNFMSTYLKFKVGDLEVKNLVLVENHFYKNHRIASYVFKFPYCAPNSVNSWQYVYELPKIKKEFIEDIKKNGTVTTSDTFFFVEGKMVMHNKSEYVFSD